MVESQINFDEYYVHYPQLLKRSLWLCRGNQENAEDLVQDVFLRILSMKQPPQKWEGVDFYPYLKKLLHRRFIKTKYHSALHGIPMLGRWGEQMDNASNEHGGAWSNTSPDMRINHWGKKAGYGRGEMKYWSDLCNRSALKEYMYLYLSDEELKELNKLTDIMFRTKFLKGLGFSRNEIASIDGIPRGTADSRVAQLHQKERLGYVPTYGRGYKVPSVKKVRKAIAA